MEIFNVIFTYPILNGLMLLYHLFGDLALSIIVLTLVIKLILFPLTLQQLKSMKATQALQPQMAQLRKKYAGDQQGQAAALQALYKEYGVNPLAGCLPLLVQMPVLYGLFFALNSILRSTTHSVSDLNSHLYPFIPHFIRFPNMELNWFTFISPSLHISLGNADPTHILPILAGLATFIQLRMSQPKTPATGTPDPTQQSMKTMQYFMPLITVFFGWTFPAGLALYWTVSTIFQAIQQFFVTGVGSLLVLPKFLGGSDNKQTNNRSNGNNGNRNYASDQGKQKATIQPDEEADAEDDDSEGPIAGQLRAVPRTGRRRSSNSASARRRSSNNAQKRKVSRS